MVVVQYECRSCEQKIRLIAKETDFVPCPRCGAIQAVKVLRSDTPKTARLVQRAVRKLPKHKRPWWAGSTKLPDPRAIYGYKPMPDLGFPEWAWSAVR